MLALFRRLWYSLRPARHEADLLEEMETHRSLRQEALEREGLSPEEAARASRRALGNVALAADDAREEWIGRAFDSVRQDARIALRGLRKSPGFSIAAILIIGIGVGASTTVFGVISALWLRPLPFDEPDRLVWLANGTSENVSNQTLQVGHFLDLREQSRSLAGLAAFSPFYGVGDVRMMKKGEPERVTRVPVTEGFFPLLGVRLWLGRNFTADESLWNAPKTAILSYAFWQRRLDKAPDVIGRSIDLNGAPVTVVGVLPESFDFSGTFSPGRPADLFVPYPLSDETNRRGNVLAVIGRMKPGIDVMAAAAETAATAQRIVENAPEVEPGRRRNKFVPTLSRLQNRISGRFHSTLAMLAGAVGFLMLLVSANISNLLLARAVARRKEMVLRMALGAGRARLVRQLLVESLTLSSTGAALGLVLAFGGTGLIAHIDGASIPLLRSVRVDALAILFIASVAILTGVGFGVLPALQASGSAPHDALKGGGRGDTGSGGGLRRVIVVTEFVLVCMLLTGAGLLTRSLGRVLDVDPGFNPENLVSLRVDPPRLDRPPTLEARNAYFETLLRHVRSVPGVEGAAITDALPLGDNFGWRGWSVSAREHAGDRDARTNGLVRMIDDAYFTTMGIRMKAGRGFTAEDQQSTERVVVINEALARKLWPGEDPLGRELRTSGVDYRVVGIVDDVRYFALERDTGQEMYMLVRQVGDYSTIDLVARSVVPATTLIPAIRAALHRADPGLPTVEFKTMEQLVDRSVLTRRIVVRLLAGFAIFGLILASLGLFAVISYSVNERTREIGVRMALGAAPSIMRIQILNQTLTLAAIGLAIGLPAAWLSAAAIQSQLFGVVSSDPVTYGAVIAVVAMVAAFAGYVPARRASRIEPMVALRSE